MMIEIPLAYEHVLCLGLWSFVCFLAGAMVPWLGASMKFDNILEYIKLDEDDAWYHKADYEEVKKERDDIKEKHQSLEEAFDDTNKRCEALYTQIECLKAENCQLKLKKEEL